MDIRQKRLQIASTLLTAGIIIFYLTTGLYKFLMRTHISTLRFGPVIKMIYEIFVLLYIFWTLDKVKLQILLGIFLLYIDFLIGQFFLSQAFSGQNMHFIENNLLFFRYVIIFLFFAVGYEFIKYRHVPEKIEKTFRSLLWINGFLIFLGLIFRFRWLASYDSDWRFGYNGLFFSTNESSFMYIIAITYLYFRRVYLGIKEKLFWWVIFSSVLIGTKTILGFLLILMFIHFFRNLGSINLKFIVLVIIAVVASSYGFFYKIINKFLLNTYLYFHYVYTHYGLLYTITSGRSAFIEERVIPLLQKWTWVNYLTGGMIMGKYNVEMDFLDLYLMFGLIGSIIYLSMFNGLIKVLYLPRVLKIFFIVSTLGLAFVAGHFFTSDTAGLFFVILILITYKYYLNQKYVKH